MRRLFMWLLAAGLLIGVPAVSFAQYAGTTGRPSIGQVLVREGDYAIRLSQALGVGTTDNEAEAESSLASLGIAPKSGWISDYPVTPDIIADLQAQVESASTAGRLLPTGKDDAVRAFVSLNTELGLSITPAANYQGGGYAADQGAVGSDAAYADPSAPAYPDPVAENNYYEQAPPVVTYYAPPPDYAYLYNWNPFPFFFGGVLFPGFFVLADFSIALFNNPFIFDRDEFFFFRNHHFHDHDFVSNHFRDHDGHFSRFESGHRFGHGDRFDGRHDGRAGFDGRHDGMSRFNRDSASRLASRDFNRRGDFGRAREGAVRSGEGQVRRSWSGSSMPSRNDRVSGASPGFGRGFRDSRSFSRPSGTSGRSFGGSSFGSAPSARSFGRSFSAPRMGGGRSFSSPSFGGGGRSFGGERSLSEFGRSFGSGGGHSFGGGGSSRSFGGSHGFGGGGSSRSFGGSHGFGGGGRSFGGGGGHGFGGGGHGGGGRMGR